MRKAFSYGLIDDEQAWIALLNARNQTSHIYDDATAQEIYSQIESEFVSLFDKLIEQLNVSYRIGAPYVGIISKFRKQLYWTQFFVVSDVSDTFVTY